jgi:hypothetical protein
MVIGGKGFDTLDAHELRKSAGDCIDKSDLCRKHACA